MLYSFFNTFEGAKSKKIKLKKVTKQLKSENRKLKAQEDEEEAQRAEEERKIREENEAIQKQQEALIAAEEAKRREAAMLELAMEKLEEKRRIEEEEAEKAVDERYLLEENDFWKRVEQTPDADVNEDTVNPDSPFGKLVQQFNEIQTPEEYDRKVSKIMDELKSNIDILKYAISRFTENPLSCDFNLKIELDESKEQIKQQYINYELMANNLYTDSFNAEFINKEATKKLLNTNSSSDRNDTAAQVTGDNSDTASGMSKSGSMQQTITHIQNRLLRETRDGKYQQLLRDKKYVYTYNTHYGYFLTGGIGIMAALIAMETYG